VTFQRREMVNVTQMCMSGIIRVGQWVTSVHKILKVLLWHQLVFIVPATHELDF